jgi:sporulation protein YlmC with PRC-barrel domain
MGLLTPLIMGVLGREQRAAGLDAGGLARVLTEQKADIAAAMPAGLGKLIEPNKPLREGIASPSSPERRTYERPSTAYRPVAMQRAHGNARWRATWPYWVLPLLALAGLLWYLFAREPETGPVATSNVQTKTAYLSTAPDTWVSIGHAPNDYVNKDIYNRAGEQLGTIKDVLVGPDGKMAAAIINVGRFLGIGDKEIAVPFSAIQQQRSDSGQRIVVDITKDNLQAAPAFVRQSKR